MSRMIVVASVGLAFFALPQTVPGQDAQEIQRLREQIEALQKENELLKQQIERLKQGSGRGTDIKPETRRDELVIDLGNGVTMEFIRIKAGEFLMGSPDSDKEAPDYEKPRHRVKLTKDFYLAKYPVTQEQYLAVMGTNPSQFKTGFKKDSTGKLIDTKRFPVDHISWDNATAFCSELRQRDKEKRHYALPTEAEWEYAQRAGTTTKYYFGDDPDDLGAYEWFNGNSDQRTHEVGTKKPNPWGLYDMGGNIWQWCADRSPSPYKEGDLVDPKGPASGEFRILRGNQWGLIKRTDSATMNSRSASRSYGRPGFMQDNFGFRVCIHLD